MNLFYRNITLVSLIGIGFFLFLQNADTLSQNPIFSQPLAAKTVRDAANCVLVFFAVLILVNWVIEARKKARNEKISFLNGLFAVFVDFGEAHRRKHEAFDESIPAPLKQSLPNGLFWLLFMIVIGFGSIFFYVWRSQGHL
jgi:hypothetical protein